MGKPSLDPEFCLRNYTVRAHAVFDGDAAGFVLAKRRVNQAVMLAQMAVDDGEIFFPDGTAFQNFSKLARDDRIFGDDDNTAGFAVETIHQMRLREISQMQPCTANETGPFAVFGRMTNEAGGLVDDQQFSVFKNNFKKFEPFIPERRQKTRR